LLAAHQGHAHGNPQAAGHQVLARGKPDDTAELARGVQGPLDRGRVVGSAIAAAGGLLYGLAYPVLDPLMGVRIGWWAFIAAVVGGIGNIRGAMLGGFILGAVEVFTPLVLPSSTYRDFVAFSLLLVLLIFKPTGILGRPVFERV